MYIFKQIKLLNFTKQQGVWLNLLKTGTDMKTLIKLK
jgi:hypothetical protein